jgi:hypothetical protein
MLLGLWLWTWKRKRDLRRHAQANGIELDSDGWPVDRSYTIAEDLGFVPRGQFEGDTPTVSPQRNIDTNEAPPPPPYRRPVIEPPAPSYVAAPVLAHRAQL